MVELIPIILGAVCGALVRLGTKGRVRFALSVCTIIVCGACATVLSGEFLESWMYALLDFGAAALGLAIGFAIARLAPIANAHHTMINQATEKDL